MSFVVIRHSVTGGVGTSPVEALPLQIFNGWCVVSDEAAEPSDFHLADFAEAEETDRGLAYREHLEAQAAPAADLSTEDTETQES